MHTKTKKFLVLGASAGVIGAVLVFGMCLWASTLPAVTQVSLTWSFRPWYRSSNWLAALIAFAFVGVVAGALAALRPDRSKKP